MQRKVMSKISAILKSSGASVNKWAQWDQCSIGINGNLSGRRLITTKQPTKATAAAAKPAQYEEEDDLKDDEQSKFNHQTASHQEQSIKHLTVDKVQENDKETNNVRKRWQSPIMKTPVIMEVHNPISTCETLEEFEARKKKTFFQYAPDADAADTLPAHEWRSIFHLFTRTKGMSLENIQLMRTILGAKGHSLKEYNDARMWRSEVEDQTLRHGRIKMLGPDLAAAHFIVFRDGKVRFHGKDQWVCRDEEDEYQLPREYEDGYTIKDIDASGMKLLYEGLQNFDGCKDLRSINLSKCPHADNFFIDRICRQHHESLKSLDISYCPLISIGAITSLIRLTNLTDLNVEGLVMEHLYLACLTLEDELPELVIRGVDTYVGGNHLSQQAVDAVNRRLRQDRQHLGKSDIKP